MTLRELAARAVNDLIVALALCRSGPLKGGLKDAFVAVRYFRQDVLRVFLGGLALWFGAMALVIASV